MAGFCKISAGTRLHPAALDVPGAVAGDGARVSGVWGARHLEMRSVQDGARTVLSLDRVRFDTHLDAKLFTPEALAESQWWQAPSGEDNGNKE